MRQNLIFSVISDNYCFFSPPLSGGRAAPKPQAHIADVLGLDTPGAGTYITEKQLCTLGGRTTRASPPRPGCAALYIPNGLYCTVHPERAVLHRKYRTYYRKSYSS